MIGGFFGFLVGLGYGVYIVVTPEPSLLSNFVHFIAKMKGVVN
jgi:hypothetical protein